MVPPVQRTRTRIDKYARARHDFRVLWRRHGNFDYVDAKQRRVRVFVRLFARAASQFFCLAHKRCARDVDEDVFLIVRIHHQRMRMRAAAGLHRRHLLGILDVRNVENSHAAEAVLLRGWHTALSFFPRSRGRRRRLRRKSLCAAIQASIRHFHGHEQQILVHRHIALPARAHHRSHDRGLRRIGDVVNVDAVKIPWKRWLPWNARVRVREGRFPARSPLQPSASATMPPPMPSLADRLLHLGIVRLVRPELKRFGLLDQQQVLHAYGRSACIVEAGRQ